MTSSPCAKANDLPDHRALALQFGAYLHPEHNIFLSVAYRPRSIAPALLATAPAFAASARR